jgi:prepilin-type N-terminal cleavage/methylation domain-containing protein
MLLMLVRPVILKEVMGLTKRSTGFTIVELLIVVVVIAILAAITIISYTGIQQRASNTAIIDAAGKSKRMVKAYVAANESYPYTGENEYVCITTDTTCRRNSSPMGVTPAFDTAMATIGSLPRSAPLASNVRGGVMYNYYSARTVDGAAAPAMLSYYLKGVNTNCGFPVINTENSTATTLSTGYTIGDVGGAGVTYCLVSI